MSLCMRVTFMNQTFFDSWFNNKVLWSMRYIHIPFMYSVVSNLLAILFSKPFLFFITINVSYICESFFFRLFNLVKYVCTMNIHIYIVHIELLFFHPFSNKKEPQLSLWHLFNQNRTCRGRVLVVFIFVSNLCPKSKFGEKNSFSLSF